jgi:hypothetical protein
MIHPDILPLLLPMSRSTHAECRCVAQGSDMMCAEMYEHRWAPLLPWPAFRRRLVKHANYALIMVAMSLLVGTCGFWILAGQAPVDAFLNAAMLLGGMGPVGEIRSIIGKLFAAVFALYAGLAFLGVAALLFAPMFHRLMHSFHLEEHRRGPRPHADEPRRTGTDQ